MAPPADEPAAATLEPPPRDSKLRCPSGSCTGAGARLLSIGVQAVVMAAALALFLLFAAAAAILLLHFIVTARAFRHRHHGGSRYRVATASTPSPPPLPAPLGLSPTDLRLLPCFAASPCDDPSSSPLLCAVCLEAACAGERWRALPACGHSFHAACVDRWLARSASCPVCRAAIAISVS